MKDYHLRVCCLGQRQECVALIQHYFSIETLASLPSADSIAAEDAASTALIIDAVALKKLISNRVEADTLCATVPVLLITGTHDAEIPGDIPLLAGSLTASTADELLDELAVGISTWQARQSQQRQRKLANIGRFATGVAHDLNNSLTVILGNLELLTEISTAPDQQEMAQETRKAALGILDMTRRLSRLASPDTEASHCDLGDLLQAVADDAGQWLPAADKVTVDAKAVCVSLINRQRMMTALQILLQNAVEASPKGDVFTFRLGTEVPPRESMHRRYFGGAVGTGGAVITLEDHGDGMTRGQLLAIGEPFVSSRFNNRARGLGLAVVLDTLRQEGGSLVIDSLQGEGTRVHCCLPARTGELIEVSAPARETRALKILLVEDNPGVRRAMELMLRQAGHEVDGVDSAYAALRRLSENGAVDVLVTDVELTGDDDGHALNAIVADMHKTLPVLLVSGLPPGGSASHQAFLPKPFSAEQLRNAVETLAYNGVGATIT